MVYPYQSLFLEMGLGEPLVASELAAASFDPNGSFAIDLWLKLSDCNTTKRLLSKEGCFSLLVRKDKLEWQSEGFPAVIAQEGILSDTWVYVAISCYHGNLRIFLDGSPAAEQVISATAKAFARPVEIGRDFFGSLRLLRVYSSALTAQDVETMMYQDSLTAEMSAYYDFTRNPPKQLKSGRVLTLPESCAMLCAMPSARCSQGAYLDVSADESVNPAGKRATPYTVQLWVWIDPEADAPVCTIFYNSDHDSRLGMSLCLIKCEGGYLPRAAHWKLESTAHQAQATNALAKGVWHNLAVTWQNKVLTLYAGGVQVAQKTDTVIPDNALTQKMTFLGAGTSAHNPNGENWFSGCISRADVWDKVLTPAELVISAAREPDWNAEGLTGSWSFFTNFLANRVNSRPVARMNALHIRENSTPAKAGQTEPHFTLSRGAVDPLTHKQLASCRARAIGSVGNVAASETLRANTCAVNDTIYFVLHDAQRSYTVCELPAEALAEDPMLQWKIELILVLLGALISLLFSTSLSYNTRLGNFLRLEVAVNPQILIRLSNVRDVVGAGVFIVAFLRQLLAENKMWQLLTLCVQISFWSVVSGLTKLTAKLFGGPASWTVWLLLAGGAIVYHLSKKPQELPDIMITSILFSHRKAGSVCSINIRKNENESWPRPEWQPATETERVPAVYRITRFTANTDPLQIAVTFESSNPSDHQVVIQGRAVGANAALTGDTDTVTVRITNGVSGTVYFTLAAHTLQTGGIRRADFSWKWQYQKDGVWKDIKTTNHRVYTILDSVGLPWSAIPDQVNNPWTDCMDLAHNWIAGTTTTRGAASALTNGLYHSGRVRYSGGASYATAKDVGGVISKAFLLTYFMEDWKNQAAVSFNCEDCADFIITFANLLGCRLWQVGLGSGFAVPNILLIGETAWRSPDDEHLGPGYFSFHMIACEALNNGASLDPTQYQVYDPCMEYHDGANNVILARGVQLSQYAVLPAVPINPPPTAGFYREDLIPNTAQGIAKCGLLHARRLYLA